MKKCYIGGCVLNCEKYLYKVFENIEKIGSLFDEYKIIIAYDISTDDTLNILNNLCEKLGNDKMRIIINKNKLFQQRSKNICYARNSILNLIRDDNLEDYEYFIMIDMDDVCSYPVNIELLKKHIEKDEKWDCLTFNKRDYYDLWALSIDEYIFSCWHWEDDINKSKEIVKYLKKYITNKLKSIEDNKLLDCYSAFNGFAIYKKNKFINCHYESDIYKTLEFIPEKLLKKNIKKLNKFITINNPFATEDCEHRHFHLQAFFENYAKIKISPEILFDENSYCENNCKYVCSRGILKSCDVISNTPFSSVNVLLDYDMSKMRDGCTIYVCNYAINHLLQLLKFIPFKFVLVSGDSDNTIPFHIFSSHESFLSFISSDKIIHWYSQNFMIEHPKITKIPIGLDYHTIYNNTNHEWGERITPKEQEDILENISKNSTPFWERKIKCYANFHFSMENITYGHERKSAVEKIDKNLIYYEENKVKRIDSWKKQSEFAFVLSPPGNGYDCHRTWEALCLGCIPIVKKSGMDNLFDELPVLLVNDWNDINNDLLTKTIDTFRGKRFNYDKLLLKYWVNKFKN
jgi:hypothetical protein